MLCSLLYSVLNELRCQVNKPCLNQLVGRTSLASAPQLTSRLETDSSAHLDKRNKHHHMNLKSRFGVHSPRTLHCYFRKQHGHLFCLPSKEACLNAGADWLSSVVSQRMATGQLRSRGRISRAQKIGHPLWRSHSCQTFGL